jgi:hypothetical protein
MGTTNLQRDVGSRVVRHNLSNLPNIAVPILALVRAKTPVRHHSGQTGKSSVLGCDLLRAGTGEEIEVKHAACRDGGELSVCLSYIAHSKNLPRVLYSRYVPSESSILISIP